nr:MAG TPA: hypothetical protein [Caudoviricetes sp.]
MALRGIRRTRGAKPYSFLPLNSIPRIAAISSFLM